MYIRRTHTSNSATGETYSTHRLVQSEYVGGRVRQLSLLNLAVLVAYRSPLGVCGLLAVPREEVRRLRHHRGPGRA